MTMYLRFGAMILTAMVVMYGVMFVSSWELSHVRFSQSRMFMALTMGGTMGLIMLGWMLNMYRNTKANLAIVMLSILLLGLGTFLDRGPTHGAGHLVHERDDPAPLDGDHKGRACPTPGCPGL